MSNKKLMDSKSITVGAFSDYGTCYIKLEFSSPSLIRLRLAGFLSQKLVKFAIFPKVWLLKWPCFELVEQRDVHTHYLSSEKEKLLMLLMLLGDADFYAADAVDADAGSVAAADAAAATSDDAY